MNERLNWIDTLRGLAIILMMIYHFIYDLNYLQITSVGLDSFFFLILARFVQFVFLSLVGFSLFLSFLRRPNYKVYLYHQLKRSFIIMFFALLISLFSFCVVGDFYVRFGILHFISVSILLISLSIRYKSVLYLWIFLGFILPPFLSNLFSASLFTIPLGLVSDQFRSVDFFPVFPWISVVATGSLLAHYLYQNKELNYLNFISNHSLAYLGRRSLLIYLIHQPIFLLVIYFLDWLYF